MRSYRVGLGIAAVMGLLLPIAEAQAAVRYVSPAGSGGGGQSWTTAYKTIQAAIDDAGVGAGDVIRVAQGTYKITDAITVAKAVKIYGGYSGTGDERNPDAYPTIIDSQDDARHAFDVTADAVFDGLTITRGYAWGFSPHDYGGGILIRDCAATVSDCKFDKNHTAHQGGAIAAIDASGTRIVRCEFTDNTSLNGGSGIYIEGMAGVQVESCTFTGNTTQRSGAGIYNHETDTTILDCTFSGNQAAVEGGRRGGGILNYGGWPTVTDCFFTDNLAEFGAGLCNEDSAAVITDCTFADCDPTTRGGGGIYNLGGSPTIRRCLFSGNSVESEGGAVHDRSDATFVNCVMEGNYTLRNGGAVYVDLDEEEGIVAHPQFINCTMSGNTATQGGAIYSYNGEATLVNCILWGNRAHLSGPGIFNYTLVWPVETIATYSNIEGNSVYPGTGNIMLDPQFTNASSGDLHLLPGSPCIDAGSNAPLDGTRQDYDGNTRLVDGDGDGLVTADMGAFEAELSSVPVQHVLRGEIMQGTLYDTADDLFPTYAFSLLVETDSAVEQIDFQTPAGGTVYSIQTFETAGTKRIWEYWVEFDSPEGLDAYGDGTYHLTARATSGGDTEMDVLYVLPGTTDPIPEPTQKPRITSPGYDESVESPVRLIWDECRDVAANTIFLTITNDTTGTEVVSEVFGRTTATAGPYALARAQYMAELGFASLYEGPSSDGTPFRYGKFTMLGHPFEVTSSSLLLSNIHRFWSRRVGSHFYTLNEAEKDKLVDQFSSVWAYEGPAFQASPEQSDSDLVPVYRFWSPLSESHFYTLSETEKDKLVNQHADVWTFEGTAFYAYPEGSGPAGTTPVYRFWNRDLSTHFYTTNEAERDKLVNEYAAVFAFEGTAFYAYP